jgi:hypothetical protein
MTKTAAKKAAGVARVHKTPALKPTASDAATGLATTDEPAKPKTARLRKNREASWSPAMRTAFLAHLAISANVAACERLINVSPGSAYRERKRTPQFAIDWDAAMNQALDELEARLLERAVNGVEKDVYYAGKSCGRVRNYSDALAMFILRARRPDVYGRNGDTTQPTPSLQNLAPDATQEARAVLEGKLDKIAERLAEAHTGAPNLKDMPKNAIKEAGVAGLENSAENSPENNAGNSAAADVSGQGGR